MQTDPPSDQTSLGYAGRSDRNSLGSAQRSRGSGAPRHHVDVRPAGQQSQQWAFDKEKGFVSKDTGLCLDPMKFDADRYPAAHRQAKWPVSLQPCGASAWQKLEVRFVDIQENVAAAEKRMHAEHNPGH